MNVDIALPIDVDIASIHTLTRQWGYSATADQTRVWVQELTESNKHEMFIAKIGTNVAGWLVVEQRIFLASQNKAEIVALVVGEQFRLKGVGQSLVSAAEKWSLDKGLTCIVVRSNINRQESHKFYPNVGFTLVKTSHNYEKTLTEGGSKKL
ncbi:GNAT family N-acetyltransferase [Vibrio ulleungensis]|uniref:GNAT family N-acetyltransferase n=1 Tax=Vibrio ulleungensis TaxID=2807619 RepID=A0ABS2HDD5_9VIBR|nr:GNAT family N-acetyltransferase [Vibrio ulleungensis]MBM7035605.1 GNAT family N-acetyltransferase [Vibrio ulleungensis]